MPTLSARADIALRVCVCSAAATLLAESVWPTGHALDPVHGSPVAGVIGSALMLSLLFACVWEPLRERTARMLLNAPHAHGELIGLPALALTVLLGAGLVWVHTVLHHHLETHFGPAVAALLERGLIVATVCAFWFSPPKPVWLRISLAALLVAGIVLMGDVLIRTELTHEGWTASEIVWTAIVCVLLLRAERCFRPWTTASNRQAAAAVAAAGTAVLVLIALVHLVDQVFPLPAPLLYSVNNQDPHDWAGTMLEDLSFYGGWAGGLLLAPDISDES